MNITTTNYNVLIPKKVSFKLNNTNSNMTTMPQDEFVTKTNYQEKKKKTNTWKNIIVGLSIIVLITDVIIERKLRIEEKAQKKEKELLEESIKKLKEEAKKLEEQIQKKRDEISNLKNENNSTTTNSPKTKPPRIDLDNP